MNSSVDNHIRQLTDHVSIANKRGQAEIAEVHRALAKPMIEADVIVPADYRGKNTFSALPSATDGKPSLPRPEEGTNIYQGAASEDESLLALMGEIMLLQAKQNASTWKTMWQMTNMSMEMQAELAPIAAKAVEYQFLAQSTMTQLGADLNSTTGWSQGTGALGALGKPGYDTATKAYEEYKAKKSIEYSRDTEEEGKDPLQSSTLSDDEGQAQVLEENETWDFGKMWESLKSKAPIVGKWAYETLDEAPEMAEKAGKFSQIMVNVSAAVTQDQQQSFQGMQQQAASTVQSSQVYASFFGQNCGNIDALRHAYSQNLAAALALLQQATNIVTNSVTSMFRG